MPGLPVVLAMKPNGAGKWSGQIYNAEDGKTYAGHIHGDRCAVTEGRRLRRGRLICRAQN
jgi:uncharacterized protein (DUF2147 family)